MKNKLTYRANVRPPSAGAESVQCHLLWDSAQIVGSRVGVPSGGGLQPAFAAHENSPTACRSPKADCGQGCPPPRSRRFLPPETLISHSPGSDSPRERLPPGASNVVTQHLFVYPGFTERHKEDLCVPYSPSAP